MSALFFRPTKSLRANFGVHFVEEVRLLLEAAGLIDYSKGERVLWEFSYQWCLRGVSQFPRQFPMRENIVI